MARPKTRFLISACAAAIGSAPGLGAHAQSVEALGRQLLNTGASARSLDSVQAGVERAVNRPLEVIWLQAEIQDDMWRNPALAQALQGCTKLGTPKEGCAVSVRSAWRYTFDASSSVRQSPIFVSALAVPEAPSGTGRLNLSGSGRVYIVTPHAPGSGAIRPPAGAILLAAGSTVQLVDAAYPSIQIEVKAPEDQPLFLGNLAESDVTKVVALLVKQPGMVSATAASVLGSGQVALRAPARDAAPVQLAALSKPAEPADPLAGLASLAGRIELPAPERPLQHEAVAALDQDFSLLAGVVESAGEPARRPEPFAVATIDLSIVAGRIEAPVLDAVRIPAEPVLDQDFTRLAGIVETFDPLPPVTVASIDLGAIAGRFEVPLRELPRIAPEEALQPRDFTLLAAALEKSSELPAPAPVFTVASADFSLVAGRLELPVRELPRPAIVDAPTVQVAEVPVQAVPVQAVPVQAVPKPVQVAVASDLAKMRAEIEAEIARERERMAQTLQSRSGKQFRFGT